MAKTRKRLNGVDLLGYTPAMTIWRADSLEMVASTPSTRTRHAELLRLCARIGYSPPRSA
jgi:hypothetical protein